MGETYGGAGACNQDQAVVFLGHVVAANTTGRFVYSPFGLVSKALTHNRIRVTESVAFQRVSG